MISKISLSLTCAGVLILILVGRLHGQIKEWMVLVHPVQSEQLGLVESR